MRKKIALSIVLALAMALVAGVAFAKHHTPEERGKTLFTTVGFAGGTKACNDCHPGGGGLAKSGAKADFGPMGRTLEDAVNYCIRNAINGNPIAVDSDQMKDMTSYIRSLGAGK